MKSKSFEVIPEAEPAQIEEIADLTVKRLDQRYPPPEKILRGVHPKSHGCVKATFRINPKLGKDLQVGLFSKPGKQYQALIRFSNAAVKVEPDLQGFKHGSRGMAIKVLGIGGRGGMLLEDGGARNQDFLMINTPAFAFANAPDYLRLTQVIHQHDDNPLPFFAPLFNPSASGLTPAELLRTKRSAEVLEEIQAKPVANPLGVQYFSAAPFLFGPARVMKFSAVPAGGEQPQLFPADISENYLREALRARMQRKKNVVFNFKIQVRKKGEEGLDIEDASTVWDESRFPFVTVARITIPTPQEIPEPDADDDCEKRVFTPWHSLKAHRPLGSINRLRKDVYIASATHRGRNGDE